MRRISWNTRLMDGEQDNNSNTARKHHLRFARGLAMSERRSSNLECFSAQANLPSTTDKTVRSIEGERDKNSSTARFARGLVMSEKLSSNLECFSAQANLPSTTCMNHNKIQHAISHLHECRYTLSEIAMTPHRMIAHDGRWVTQRKQSVL